MRTIKFTFIYSKKNHLLSRFIAVFLCFAAMVGVVSAGNWQQFHGDSSHDGYNSSALELDSIYQMWVYDPANDSDRSSELKVTHLFNKVQPILSSDGSMVFVYGVVDGKNLVQLIALDTLDGRSVWVRELYAATDYSSISAPVYHEGYIYWIGSNDVPDTYIYKINAKTGTTKSEDGGWIYRISGHSVVNASPLVVGNRLFFSSYPAYGSSGAVHYAIDTADGSVLWSNDSAGGQGQGAWVYSPDSKYVYQSTAVGGGSNISAFDPDNGTVVMTTENVENGLFQLAIAYADGKLYLQDYDFYGTGFAYVFDAATGKILVKSNAAASGDSCPAVYSDGSFYVSGDWQGAGKIRGFSADGSVLWTSAQAGGWQNSPAIRDHYLFVGAQNANELYLFDLDNGGDTAVSLQGAGPVAFADNSFFSVGYDGKLYAYTCTTPETLSFEIKVSPSGGGSSEPVSGMISTKQYAPLEVKAEPEPGYVFREWLIDRSEGRVVSRTVAETQAVIFTDGAVLTAVFEQKDAVTLAVAVSASGGGTVDPEGELSVHPGTKKVITAAPERGYYFSGWSCEPDGAVKTPYAATLHLKVNDDISLVANFAKATPGESGKSRRPMVSLKVQSKKRQKNRIQLKNLPLPAEEMTFTAADRAILIVGGCEFAAMSYESEQDNKYIFSLDDADNGKLKLELDTGAHLWSFSGTGIASRFASVAVDNGLDIQLRPGKYQFGLNVPVYYNLSWSMKSDAEKTLRTENDMAGFNILKAKGRVVSHGKNRGDVNISRAELSLAGGSFEPEQDAVKVSVGDYSFLISAGSSELKKKKGNSYQFVSNDKTVKLMLDFDKGRWSFRKKWLGQESPVVPVGGSLDIALDIGEQYGHSEIGVEFKAVVKSR